MKHPLLLSLFLPVLGSSLCADENDLAMIMTNEESYQLDIDLNVVKKELSNLKDSLAKLTDKFADTVKNKDLETFHSKTIDPVRTELEDLQKQVAGLSENKRDLQVLKKELSELSEKLAIFSEDFFFSSSRKDANEQMLLSALNPSTNPPPQTATSPAMTNQPSPPSLFQYREPLDLSEFISFAEYLYMGVSQQDSEFVLAPNMTFPAAVIADLAHNAGDSYGRYKQAKFNWSSGLRVGLGYTFTRDYWQLLGQYTYYDSVGTKVVTNPASDTLIFATFRDVTITQLEQAQSKVHLNYQVADVLLSKRLTIGDQILLNFNIGMTGAWIEEHWRVTYFDEATTFFKNKWKYNSGGFTLGLESNWHFGMGFGLFSKFFGSVVCGSYKNKNYVSTTIVPAGDINPLRNTSLNTLLIIPRTQIALGVDWGQVYSQCALRIMTGFEINTWFDLQQVFKSPEGTQPLNHDKVDIYDVANVNVYGLTVRAEINF